MCDSGQQWGSNNLNMVSTLKNELCMSNRERENALRQLLRDLGKDNIHQNYSRFHHKKFLKNEQLKFFKIIGTIIIDLNLKYKNRNNFHI